MEKNHNVPDAKNRILQAALKIFAEKSFDGARIDEISEEAGVPKSLIYYHFKHKEDILDTLLKNFIDDSREFIKNAEQGTKDSIGREIMRHPDIYKNFVIKNIDLIRIILLDSLKKNSTKPFIFQFVEMMINAEEEFINSRNPSQKGEYNKDERLIAEFFTDIIPIFTFLCFYDSWSSYFKINGEDLEKLFAGVIDETHGSYHKSHNGI